MTVPPPEGGALDGVPQSGELKIKERRSWKTWQLLSVALVAAILGMWINGDTGGGGSSSATSSNPDGGKLPAEGAGAPAASAAGGTTTTAARGSSATTTTAAGGGSATTTTTAAGGATTTTVAGGSTTATTAAGAAAGPARVLLLSPQEKGNWTSTAFTTTGAWNIGWAFSCAPAPAGGPSFQVYVTPAGSSASPTGTAAVSETGATGQSVTPQSSLGAQELVVQTTASCSWIVKVTGS